MIDQEPSEETNETERLRDLAAQGRIEEALSQQRQAWEQKLDVLVEFVELLQAEERTAGIDPLTGCPDGVDQLSYIHQELHQRD